MKVDPESWIRVDPDAATRAELQELLDNDPAELQRRFAGHLNFGTAGIRGALGAGPMRMNRVLIRTVATALGRVVLAEVSGDQAPRPTVVIAHDARHGSESFADDTARVLAGLGVASILVPGTHPTPLLAFGVRYWEASAGVMVTASHNPANDNGYKVYWSDGVQIIPPIDRAISDAMDDIGLVDPDSLAPPDHPLITRRRDELIDAYVASRVQRLDPDGPRALRVVYTPLHGVGADLAAQVFAAAGFEPLIMVESQSRPDPDFPTVEFPNPEEPGALDAALALADSVSADIVFANDPDADRLAVAVPDADGAWRALSGNEIGAVLGDHLLRRGSGPARLVATTVVSSRLLASLAAEYGVEFAETLTGFKWILRPALARPDLEFVFGFEEALGFAVDDDVRDKDGLAAMVVFAELAAELASTNQSVLGRLADIFRRHGVHRTAQRSVRLEGAEGAETIAATMRRLRSAPPQAIAGRDVTQFTDLLTPTEGRATTDAVILLLGDGSRLVARPSGTEPKLKLYGEVVVPAGDSVVNAEAAGDQEVERLLASFAEALDLG